ncbi:MAG: TonB-dependent receptor [Bacteroidetes bacterium]|nr:TonB-dependent receptor [Bacteroidota bacterium]MDA0860555.1 TonB-dependent receptor [Bacteroidota bacterium]MDA1318319.1 TonB-dependent receptor [Bacteroidota bacterium]
MKYYLSTLLLFFFGLSFSQVKLEGFVKDSLGNPLELANVIAINKATSALDSYGITNDEGKYRLDLKKNTTYSIQVSYIGMKSIAQALETGESNATQNFTLQEDNALEEVELTYEMPVTISGDTLVYNADSFNKGTERKLEDVLENLPGVEINDDGQVEVEGKVVSKLMVEGKDFFDGDTKLATKNIPSNAVDKVQVLKNYSEVSQLGGVTNNQNNVAINIKLKEGKKNFWFGNVTAGAGDSDNKTLYLAQPKLFYYSPDYSINFIGDLNNIGEVAFSRRDYFNFTGGFRRPSLSSGTSLNLGSNDIGFLTLQNDRAKDVNTKFAATNFSWSPKKTLDLGGFAIFSNSRNELQENRTIEYTNPDLNIPDERTESNTVQENNLGMLKLSSKYQPNANNQMEYDIFCQMSKSEQDQRFFSSINNNIDQLEETTPYNVSQNLNYYYTLDENNIFALEAQHVIKDEDPFYNAILEDKLNYGGTAANLGLDDNQSNYNLAQEKRVKSNQLDAKLDYWNILNKKSNINFTFGTILSHQKFDSNIFQFLDDNSQLDTTPTINDGLDVNAIDYNFSDIYLGLHYRLKTGIFTITPGVSAHLYNVNNTQFGQKTTDNFFRLLPDLNVIVQLKKSETLNLTYSMQTQFTDVSNFASGLVLNNYNALFSGNPALENALSHNVNLFYYSFNMFNYTNVFASINYNKSIDNIRTESIFQPGGVIRVSTPFNSSFADESVTANGRFQRTFGKIRGTLRANFNYSKFNQFIQNRRSINENFTQTYRAQVRTNFRTAPNLDVSYRYSIQDNNLGENSTKFFTKSPTVELDALFLKSFTFRTDYSYNDFSDENGTINTFEFWNASITYRKDEDAKFEYEIKATNLLDTKAQSQSNAGTVSVSATEYFIQPRFITFRVRYEL